MVILIQLSEFKKKIKNMKKYSNIDIKKNHKNINKPKIEKIVEKIIQENLTVAYSGNSDDLLDKNLSIAGVDKFIEKFNLLINTNNKRIKEKTLESLKYQGIKNDQITISKRIDFLKEQINDTIILSPEDIFSSEDYIIKNKIMNLNSLNNIPIDFLDYINIRELQRYYDGNNSILISENNQGWEVSFKNSDKYGISIDDKNEKYNKFIKENNNFIADFISATTNLIGSKNIILEKKLIG